MHRLNILAKGNLDVRDSLHSFALDGKVVWNGINEIVRQRFEGNLVRVRHEPLTRLDALMDADDSIPAEIATRDLPLAPLSAKSQFSAAVFSGEYDAIILSIQPDIITRMHRHGRDGYLFCTPNLGTWSNADRAWVKQTFLPLDLIDVQASMEALSRIVSKIRGTSRAPILVYNVSAVSPGETIYCYEGLEDVFSIRARRFNLALSEMSILTGIYIVDVDTIVARAGADRVKLDQFHLTAEGNRLVAEEVVRILDDQGCFAVNDA